jgi:hypothetical protein
LRLGILNESHPNLGSGMKSSRDTGSCISPYQTGLDCPGYSESNQYRYHPKHPSICSPKINLKEQWQEIFDPRFFSLSTPHRSLINRLKPFRIRLRIRRDNSFASRQNRFYRESKRLWNRFGGELMTPMKFE